MIIIINLVDFKTISLNVNFSIHPIAAFNQVINSLRIGSEFVEWIKKCLSGGVLES